MMFYDSRAVDAIKAVVEYGSGLQKSCSDGFGMTDELLGDVGGVFGYERGFCQGTSQSPAGCVALYDVLLEVRRICVKV